MIFSLRQGLIYFVAGLVVMFLLMRGCSEPPQSETVYIKGKTLTDTIYVERTKTIVKPVPYRVESVREVVPDSLRTAYCDSVRDYRSGVDSAGIAIDVTSTVQGVLLSQAITYRLPQISSSRVDTMRITTERNYRYEIGAVTDGRGIELIGTYKVARNVRIAATWDATNKFLRAGGTVTF